MGYMVTVGDRSFFLEIEEEGKVTVDGRGHAADIEEICGSSLYSLLLDGSSYELFIEERGGEYRILLGGELYTVRVEDERRRLSEEKHARLPSEALIKAPMPGLVVDVPVGEGDAVQTGQCLVILEAMKMENELQAPREGTVGRVQVAKGDKVEKGQVLLEVR